MTNASLAFLTGHTVQHTLNGSYHDIIRMDDEEVAARLQSMTLQGKINPMVLQLPYRLSLALLRRSFFVALLVIALGASPSWAWQNSPSWASSEPQMPFVEINEIVHGIGRKWLVMGTVLRTHDNPSETVVTLQIDHVYAGPDALQGRTFDARFSKDFSHAQFFDFDYLNAFAAGQRVVSAVEWRAKKGSFIFDPEADPNDGRLDYSRAYGFPLPTVLDGRAAAREVQEHGQRIEAVYRAAPERRQTMMLDYARSDIPLTTDWAISAVGNPFWNDGGRGHDFLKQLARDKKRPFPRLARIDYVLCQGWRGDDWVGSADRVALWTHIATTPQAGDGGQTGYVTLTGLDFRLGSGQLSSRRMASFWEMFVRNPTVSDASRRQAIEFIGQRLDYFMIASTDAFWLWTTLLRESQNAEVVRACAEQIRQHPSNSSDDSRQLQSTAIALEKRLPGASKELGEAIIEALAEIRRVP